MLEITDKSCFLRMKESLVDNDKVLLIDKDGFYTQKTTFNIYCGLSIRKFKSTIMWQW